MILASKCDQCSNYNFNYSKKRNIIYKISYIKFSTSMSRQHGYAFLHSQLAISIIKQTKRTQKANKQ